MLNKTYFLILLFFILNFGALALGGISTSGAVMGEWYQNLDKAPWTPPGFVFGLAWTTIMVCFSLFNALWFKRISGTEQTRFWIFYGLQWVLNVAWNPLFFTFHFTGLALIEISILTALVTYFLYSAWIFGIWSRLLILPYFVWMFIATSLNAYIVWAN
jgi:tryptophan-rich sensory protein